MVGLIGVLRHGTVDNVIKFGIESIKMILKPSCVIAKRLGFFIRFTSDFLEIVDASYANIKAS